MSQKPELHLVARHLVDIKNHYKTASGLEVVLEKHVLYDEDGERATYCWQGYVVLENDKISQETWTEEGRWHWLYEHPLQHEYDLVLVLPPLTQEEKDTLKQLAQEIAEHNQQNPNQTKGLF